MTEILNDRADAGVDSGDEALAVVGIPPSELQTVETILDDTLVEDVSIDGMCGVY